jgi:hypothetical protein
MPIPKKELRNPSHPKRKAFKASPDSSPVKTSQFGIVLQRRSKYAARTAIALKII